MTGSTENRLRDEIAKFGRSLFERGYGCGSSGNISVRLDDGILVTPTNSCMGFLEPERISKVAFDGSHLSGDKPSKETYFHLAMYEERSEDAAIVHLHATHSVAVSCLADIDEENVLPPMTAYYVMRIGKLPLVPYFRPGDLALADAVRKTARDHHAMLLANHGPIVSANALDAAVYSAEELEETAKLYLMINDRPHRYLTDAQIKELTEAFPN
ncbi:MAG: 3-oxo-tetronate 4-phosphate decarboxylase [Hyphomicrobiales bacterium]